MVSLCAPCRPHHYTSSSAQGYTRLNEEAAAQLSPSQRRGPRLFDQSAGESTDPATFFAALEEHEHRQLRGLRDEEEKAGAIHAAEAGAPMPTAPSPRSNRMDDDFD